MYGDAIYICYKPKLTSCDYNVCTHTHTYRETLVVTTEES